MYTSSDVSAEAKPKGTNLGSGGLALAFAKLFFLIAGYAISIVLTRLVPPEVFGLYGVVSMVIAVPNMVLIQTVLFTVSRPMAAEIARWFGIGDVELYVTAAAPRVCVPVFSNPCTILLGQELLQITDDLEKTFVLARALKIAKAQLSIVVRAQPSEVITLIGGLVHSYDPHHMPAGVDPSHVEEAARRVTRNLPRRGAEELGPMVFEMAGRPGYDPAQLAMAASQWGNRVALLATGSASAAVSALAKLSGERDLPVDPTARVAMVQRFAEAAQLLRFAISDVHFDARQRVRGGAGA